jgi:hypothetical protein
MAKENLGTTAIAAAAVAAVPRNLRLEIELFISIVLKNLRKILFRIFYSLI